MKYWSLQSDPQSAHALHILNNKYDYRTTNNIMSQLKHTNEFFRISIKHVLSHIINYRHVSIAFPIVIRVALQEYEE